MKSHRILLAIASVSILFAAAAQAAGPEQNVPYLEARNELGGSIVLQSSKPARCDGWSGMFSAASTGEVEFGCYKMKGEMAHVIYSRSGTVRFYPIKDFKMVNPPQLTKRPQAYLVPKNDSYSIK